MPAEQSFAHFIQRIRAGDADAAVELVRQYEAAIRLEVRLRLRDPRLHRVFDSMDICQSVLGSFFVRAASGAYDLEQPAQLLKLLVAMARNKVAYHARKQRSQRRDYRRVETGDLNSCAAAAPGPSPSQWTAGQELLEKVRARLTDEERELADLRGHGLGWSEIATKTGGTSQARRMQLTRAVERVARQLGLDELNDE